MSSGSHDEASRVFLRFRRIFGRGSRRAPAAPFQGNSDIEPVGSALSVVEREMGWEQPLGRAQITVDWARIAGPDIAAHTTAYLLEETVVVRCSSTAWAANLRRMQNRLLSRVHEELPRVRVTAMHFVGPDAPSWGHGFRSVPGRGPRDTYG